MAQPTFLGDGATKKPTDSTWVHWVKLLSIEQNKGGALAANNPRRGDPLPVIIAKLWECAERDGLPWELTNNQPTKKQTMSFENDVPAHERIHNDAHALDSEGERVMPFISKVVGLLEGGCDAEIEQARDALRWDPSDELHRTRLAAARVRKSLLNG